MTAGGKGHTRRPQSVSDQEYAERWDEIFGREQVLQKLADLGQEFEQETHEKEQDDELRK